MFTVHVFFWKRKEPLFTIHVFFWKKTEPLFRIHLFFWKRQGLCLQYMYSLKVVRQSYRGKSQSHKIVIITHFSVAPLCYLYKEPVKLYYVFREIYTRYFFRLHSISSHPQVRLCSLHKHKGIWNFLNLSEGESMVCFYYRFWF